MNLMLYNVFFCLALTLMVSEASIEVTSQLNGITDQRITEIQDRDSICYADLGCIELNLSWYHPIHRPINVMPMVRDRIDTQFTLFTREKPITEGGILITAKDPNGITAASFKSSRKTKFFIHGFLSNGYGEYVNSLVENLLKVDDFNVVVVHWGKGAQFTTYTQATANTRLVGLEIAFLVNQMVKELKVKAADVHLIGHSLGAHIAGYAGEKISELGRITGLDPAGPYFREMPSFVRLDASDAKFVDVVHTNGAALGYGLSEATGHLDFYANGGESQPGCELYNFDLAQMDIACDHSRAIYLYTDSLISDCKSIGYECSDYDSFNKGKCTSCGMDNTNCAPFGLNSDTYPTRSRSNVKLFFNTGSTAPYCRLHYAVSVNLARPSDARSIVNGKLLLSVSGEKTETVQLAQPIFGTKLEHGTVQPFLFSTATNFGKVKKVNLRWDYVVNPLDISTACGLFCNKKLYVNSVTISSINNYPETLRLANTYKSCPPSSPGVIGSGSSLDFSVGSSCP